MYRYACSIIALAGCPSPVTEPPKSSDKAITAFGFAEPLAVGAIDEANHAIAVTVPFGTDLTALAPTIAHTGASVSPASGVAQDFSDPVAYTVTAADGTTQPYVVTVTTAPSSAKRITLFAIASPYSLGLIDEASGSITITVPFGTELGALIPDIVYEGASMSPQTRVIQDFSRSVTYTVAAADGSIKRYTVTVTHGEQTEFAVHFAKNAADAVGIMHPQMISKNTTAVLKANTFSREGYSFKGWASSANGLVAYADKANFAMASEEATLYAVWHPLQGMSATLNVSPAGDIAISGDLSAA